MSLLARLYTPVNRLRLIMNTRGKKSATVFNFLHVFYYFLAPFKVYKKVSLTKRGGEYDYLTRPWNLSSHFFEERQNLHDLYRVSRGFRLTIFLSYFWPFLKQVSFFWSTCGSTKNWLDTKTKSPKSS